MEEIFTGPSRLKFQLEQQMFFVGASIAVQSVFEYLQVNDGTERGPAIATNIYTRTTGCWRMLADHAAVSPTAESPPAAGTTRAGRSH